MFNSTSSSTSTLEQTVIHGVLESGLTGSPLLLPREKRKRSDLRTHSFLAPLGEKQPAFPDSTLEGKSIKLSCHQVEG